MRVAVVVSEVGKGLTVDPPLSRSAPGRSATILHNE